MIYLSLLILAFTFMLLLFMQKSKTSSFLLLAGSITSSSILLLSFIPQVRQIIASLIVHNLPFHKILTFSSVNTILFLLILLLLVIYEVSNLKDKSYLETRMVSKTLIFLMCFFSGIFIFTEHVILLSITMFVIPICIFFSKIIRSEHNNFAFVFWSIIAAMCFMIASIYLVQYYSPGSAILSDLTEKLIEKHSLTSLKDFYWSPPTYVSLLFFISLIFFNTLFPLSYVFSNNIWGSPSQRQLVFFIPNILFLSLLYKLRHFNPLLLDILEIYFLINILIHAIHIFSSRSIKSLTFHHSQIITCLVALGFFVHSTDSENASIFLFFLMALLLGAICYALSIIEKKKIPTSIIEASGVKVHAPTTCTALSILLILFCFPIGPYLNSVLTIMQELSIWHSRYIYIVPLIFLIPIWTSLYILFKLFFNNHTPKAYDDIKYFDLIPAMSVLILIVISLTTVQHILPFSIYKILGVN